MPVAAPVSGRSKCLSAAWSGIGMCNMVRCCSTLLEQAHDICICKYRAAQQLTLATKTVMMMGTMSCREPVVSMTMTVVVRVMRVAPPM